MNNNDFLKGDRSTHIRSKSYHRRKCRLHGYSRPTPRSIFDDDLINDSNS